MRNFVKGISFLRTMDSNKVKGFFYPVNGVSGEPDYRFADFLCVLPKLLPMPLTKVFILLTISVRISYTFLQIRCSFVEWQQKMSKKRDSNSIWIMFLTMKWICIFK